MPTLTLNQIAALLNCPAPSAGGDRPITGMAALTDASETELSYLSSDAYLTEFNATRAAGVIVQRRVKVPEDSPTPVLTVQDADLAMATVLEQFAPPIPRPPIGIDPTARVAPSARVATDAAIGPNVVLGERVAIGAGTVLHAGVCVGDDTSLGDKCELFPNVVLRERITLGNRVVIHSGSVIGTDGFGYRWDGTSHVKVPQIGTVIIEDDVEIGSCVCIDRAKFSATRIGRGTKIDNLVQIGHNVQIGAHCIIVGQAGIAGSARLGERVILGGQSAVRDHIVMGDGSIVAACSALADNSEPKSIMSGSPALPHRQSLRENAAMRRLPDLVVQVRKLQEEIDKLKKPE